MFRGNCRAGASSSTHPASFAPEVIDNCYSPIPRFLQFDGIIAAQENLEYKELPLKQAKVKHLLSLAQILSQTKKRYGFQLK